MSINSAKLKESNSFSKVSCLRSVQCLCRYIGILPVGLTVTALGLARGHQGEKTFREQVLKVGHSKRLALYLEFRSQEYKFYTCDLFRHEGTPRAQSHCAARN